MVCKTAGCTMGEPWGLKRMALFALYDPALKVPVLLTRTIERRRQ